MGYWDEKGQMLKPLEVLTPKEKESERKMSKKEQIAQLKDKVANLPVGPAMQNNLTNNKNDLAAARPKLNLLKTAMDLLNSPLAAFLPGPLGLLSKIKTANDILRVLKNFIPKNPMPKLLSKIGNLFNRGKKLKDKAKDLVDNSNKLKDRYDDVKKKAKNVGNELDKREKAIDDLQKQLDDLAKRKADLQQKLEDKPKKILDELKRQVGDIVDDAEKFKDKVGEETKLKDKLLEELDKLVKEKDEIEQKLEDLKKEADDLGNETDELEKGTNEAKIEVDEAKQKEQQTDDLKKEMEDLKPEEEIKEEVAICEEDLKRILADLTGVKEKQGKLKNKLDRLLEWPKKILGKISDLVGLQEKLKLPVNGIPIADKALAKLDGLLGKAKALGSVVQLLTGKKTKVQTRLESYDKKLENIRENYDEKVANLYQMKTMLVGLIAEKSGLRETLAKGTSNMDELEYKVRDFIDRYNILDVKADCEDNKELEEEIEEVKKGQEEVEPELEELEKELEEADKEEQQLEVETKEVEEEIEKEGELKKEEEELKKEFGTDVKLEPVETKEWAENFEVEREYWEAEFHPDDEVVEGYSGRYFEVSLKNAEKNVQLLFGPGEYFMEKKDFRKKYGKTIGSFVTEALHSMKKTDRDKVKLFVQGQCGHCRA